MSFVHRIYSDYLMPSRLAEYESILKAALDAGYVHSTIREFFQIAESGLPSGQHIFLHRHDIDTDTATAARFFELEQKHGIKSSYYFRLSTWDNSLVQTIAAYGSEVGYHYEEIADYCKEHHLGAAAVKKHYPAIRERFAKNVCELERKSGIKFKTVASHGDFVNRIIGIANYDFITPELLTNLGIELECYDKRLLNAYRAILSDTHYPKFYKPESPLKAINRGDQVIYFLSHPRHWKSSILENTRQNLLRLREGIEYRLHLKKNSEYA